MLRSRPIGILWSVLVVTAVGPAIAMGADEGMTPAIKPVPGLDAGGAMAVDRVVDDSLLLENSLGLSAAPPESCQDCPDEGCNFGDRFFGGQFFGGPPGRLWFRADYVHYWTNGMYAPPLVTTGERNPALNSNTDPVCSLDQPTTQVLFGDGTLFHDSRSGFHMNMGLWLDACQTWGVEADWLDLGPLESRFSISSDEVGLPVYARPYFDIERRTPWRQLVSYPAVLSGTVSVQGEDYFNTVAVALRKRCFGSDEFGGCEVDDCAQVCDTSCCGVDCLKGRSCRLDLLLGYRFYGLTDHVTVHEDLLAISGALVGTRIRVTDSFRAANQFHGGEIGLAASAIRNRWTLNLTLKAALGNNRQTVNIDGRTVTTNQAGQMIVQESGVFAVRTNEGTYRRNEFVVIPQVTLEAGYMITPRWRAFVGYNLIYWACVQRSGSAIDLNIDPRNIPGGIEDPATPFPQFKFNGTNFVAQGIQSGLEFRY